MCLEKNISHRGRSCSILRGVAIVTIFTKYKGTNFHASQVCSFSSTRPAARLLTNLQRWARPLWTQFIKLGKVYPSATVTPAPTVCLPQGYTRLDQSELHTISSYSSVPCLHNTSIFDFFRP